MPFSRDWIERPQRVWLRRALFQVHLWTGIGLGLYILVVSVSGAAAVFRLELERWANPKVESDGPALGLDAIRSAAERAYPGFEVTGFLKPPDTRSPVVTWIEREKDDTHMTVLINPVTGEPMGQPVISPVIDWIVDLHVNLLAGETGMLVNGIGGGFLLLMTLTGAVVWWPGRKNWRRALTLPRNVSWKRFNWDLHSAAGFWTLLFVAMWGFTGFFFVFPEPVQQAFSVITPTLPPREGPPPPAAIPGKPFLPIDRMIAAAEAATPGAFTTWISLPHDLAWAEIIRHEYYEPWASHNPRVYVNAYAGNVEHMDIALRGNPGDTIQRWLGYLHFGNFGGKTVKALWVVLGVVPALLFVTGALMWWNRVLSKKWKKLRSGAQ